TGPRPERSRRSARRSRSGSRWSDCRLCTGTWANITGVVVGESGDWTPDCPARRRPLRSSAGRPMSIARSLLLRAADSPWLASQMSRRSFARRAVRRFMPGEELDDALGAARTLAQSGIGSLVTHLGEALTSLDAATEVRDHYLGVFDAIQQRGLPTWVSVKPTQLG